MAKNATPWIKMIRAVYDSFESGRHQGDATARRVMDTVVSWLAAGLELSPKLQARLIDNINMRTRFTVADPGTPVRLTRDQMAYAFKQNPEWFSLGLDGEDLPETASENLRKTDTLYDEITQTGPTITLPLRQFSDCFTTLFRTFYAGFPTEALALAQHLVVEAAEMRDIGTTDCVGGMSKEKEWNENESNHDGMSFAPPLHAHDLPAGSDEVPPIPLDDGEVLGHRTTGASGQRVVLSFFHNNPDAPPSGNLEIGPDKFALVFSDGDVAEEKLGEVCSPEWLSWLDQQGAESIRLESRAAGSRKTRCRMSPLYAANDRFARKAPVVADAVAVLFWNEDEQPDRVMVLSKEDAVEVALTKFYGKHAKAPTHKGEARLAA